MKEFFGIITGILKFWDNVVFLVKTLQKTPEAKRQELMRGIAKESEKFARSGRPEWD